jgi:hypothetical protein
VRAAIRRRLVERGTLLERVARTALDGAQRSRITAQITADFG